MPFSAMLTIAMVCAAVVVGLVPDESSREGRSILCPYKVKRMTRDYGSR